MKNLMRTLILTVVLALNAPLGAAQSVTIEGEGLDRNEALLAAERNAVEQVVGNFIDAETLIENSMLELSRIYSSAKGFVRNVKVLNEGKRADGIYVVRASMEVESEPNTELMSRLETIMRLNDPRISIEIMKGDSSVHDELAEALLNESMINVGFNHIVVGGAEYRVIGKSRNATNAVTVPDYRGGYKTLPYTISTADITVEIIRVSTGDIIGTFSVRGSARAGVNEDSVERDAVRAAADNAADELEKKFKRLAMSVHGNRQVVR